MAKIGLENLRYAILTINPDNSYSYGELKSPGYAMEVTVDITSNNAKLYGDNAQRESDTSFQQAAVKAVVDRADDQVMKDWLGHTIDPDRGLVRSANDVANYIGLARIVNLIVGNKPYYRVEILFKVKFSEPSQSNKTKGESTEFEGYEFNGDGTLLPNNEWSCGDTFETRQEALDYIERIFHPYPSA